MLTTSDDTRATRHDRLMETLYAIQNKLAEWLSAKISDGTATAAHLRLANDMMRYYRIDAAKVRSDPIWILSNSLPRLSDLGRVEDDKENR
jgi:hypothetical protein